MELFFCLFIRFGLDFGFFFVLFWGFGVWGKFCFECFGGVWLRFVLEVVVGLEVILLVSWEFLLKVFGVFVLLVFILFKY